MKLAALLLLSSLAGPASTGVSVRLGQVGSVGGPTVRPLRVLEDSRCPARVSCVWAGRVVVRAELRLGRSRQTVDLTLDDGGVPIGDGRLRLTAVTPAKAIRPIRQGDYRFLFDFRGGR